MVKGLLLDSMLGGGEEGQEEGNINGKHLDTVCGEWTPLVV